MADNNVPNNVILIRRPLGMARCSHVAVLKSLTKSFSILTRKVYTLCIHPLLSHHTANAKAVHEASLHQAYSGWTNHIPPEACLWKGTTSDMAHKQTRNGQQAMMETNESAYGPTRFQEPTCAKSMQSRWIFEHSNAVVSSVPSVCVNKHDALLEAAEHDGDVTNCIGGQ